MSKVQHMVLLRFKPGTGAATISHCFDEVARLPERIPGIEQYAGGPYASPEGLNKGFTHGFLMTFRSVDARNAYLVHPEHDKVKDLLLTHLEDVIAFDFEG